MLKYCIFAFFLFALSAITGKNAYPEPKVGAPNPSLSAGESVPAHFEDAEEKRRAEVRKRNEQRDKSRLERIKTLKKIDCKFETLGKWRDFLSFQTPKEKYVINGEVEDYGIEKVYLSQIGKIIKGPCKDGEILVAKFDYNEPDKSGPGPSYLFADGFLSDDDAPESDNEIDPFSYTLLIKVGSHYITAGEYEDPLLTFLMNFGDETYAYIDAKVDYYPYFLISKNLNALGHTVKIRNEKIHASPERWLSSDAKKIFDDPNIGKLYVRSLDSEMQWPDGLWSYMDIGLSNGQPGYWFDDFIEKPKFKKFGKIKLKPIAGAPGWFEPEEANEKFLKKEYGKYKARLNSLESRIQETKAAMSYFNLTPLTFSEYKKKKPYLFYKDVLGRTQVHRLSLHEIPALAEPLMYVYGEPRSRIDIKLCRNLKLKLSWPKYNEEWKIEVLNDGMLWDLKNKQKVRTLFWEGFAGPIPPLKQGWVVRPAEVKPLLERILPLYGLNDRESSDFQKYWVPVLTKAPYYRIEIIPDWWIDNICPLTISPEPEKLLRVYLRAYPKKEFEVVPEPPMPPTPTARPPYTIVEWGGVLE